MVHIYCGDGKGKTTAAIGLAVRAAGFGMKVLVAQFFKDGSSSEFQVLCDVKNITCHHAAERFGFYFAMKPEEKEHCKEVYHAFFEELAEKSADYDMVVLDEIISTCNCGIVSPEEIIAFADSLGEKELVLTGRDPHSRLLERADYVSEVVKQKHPFDRGIKARKGIEY